MKRLLRLYPRPWRKRYGDELAQLLDDLAPASWRVRLTTGVDVLRGALDAHLTQEYAMAAGTRAALQRGTLVAVAVWAVISVEIVLSNVVYPTPADDDGWSVVLSYLLVFAALMATGFLAAGVTIDRMTVAVIGAVSGAIIATLTIGTFAIIDNLFLDTVSQQHAKIHGFAHSGMSSMRMYVNVSLLFGLLLLSALFSGAGAVLATAGARIRARYRPANHAPD